MTGYGSGTLPIAVAHRGGAGIGLENTMEAFRRSWALGIRYLEFDVWLTRDRVPVLHHDRSLQRIGRTPERIADLTLDEVSRIELRPGLWIPTVADVFHAFPGAKWMIDMKDPAAIEPVLDLIDHYGIAEQVCFTGGWDRSLAVARRRLPGVHSNMGMGRMSTLLAASRIGVRASRFGVGATFLHVPYRLGRLPTYLPRVVACAHDLDLRLMVWGVEEADTMQRLLDDGVDGLIVDRPDLLRDVLIRRGQWPASTRAALNG